MNDIETFLSEELETVHEAIIRGNEEDLDNEIKAHDQRLLAKVRESVEKARQELSEIHFPDTHQSQAYHGFESGKEVAQDKLSHLLSLLPLQENE